MSYARPGHRPTFIASRVRDYPGPTFLNDEDKPWTHKPYWIVTATR